MFVQREAFTHQHSVANSQINKWYVPLLARAKRRAAANLQSHALHADSHQSDICAYLAMILLGGLGLNALFGWWWADPLAALCMVPIILREAISGLRGQPCTHEHRV